MRALCFAAVLMTAAPIAAQDAPSETRIELAVGERYVISENGVSSYSDSGPGLFDTEIDAARRIVLIGRRAGTQALLLVFEDGRQRRYSVTVTP